MKYHIRTNDGDELTVADGSHVVMLFRQKFLDPDDEIRREGSERWRKLRDIPEYAQMIRAEKSDLKQFRTIFVVTAFLGLIAIVAAALFR